MTNNYLKPMLDTGSPRVFNCNEMTQRVLTKEPDAELFFRNKALNSIVLIKDAVPENDRRVGTPSVGTKLYFPFNEKNIYEGGRTIFLHDRGIESAMTDYCGEGAVTKDSLAADMQLLRILNRIPSLDPFLMKDIFLRENFTINEGYFDVSAEAWADIESFMLRKFEPLIFAAFPDAKTSQDKARQLIDKIWEAKDFDALLPLIEAFRLPKEKALDIFSSWKGIVYYSYIHSREQARFMDLVKWVSMNSQPEAGVTAAEAKELQAMVAQIKEQLRTEWQRSDEIVRDYQASYDKMFKDKISSADFLNFLKNSDKIYWEIGNCLGRVNHAVYCWDVMTTRFDERKLPWGTRVEVMRMLAKVLEPEKKAATSVAWS